MEIYGLLLAAAVLRPPVAGLRIVFFFYNINIGDLPMPMFP